MADLPAKALGIRSRLALDLLSSDYTTLLKKLLLPEFGAEFHELNMVISGLRAVIESKLLEEATKA